MRRFRVVASRNQIKCLCYPLSVQIRNPAWLELFISYFYLISLVPEDTLITRDYKKNKNNKLFVLPTLYDWALWDWDCFGIRFYIMIGIGIFEISHKLKYPKNWSVTKCHTNFKGKQQIIFNDNYMSQRMKCHNNWNATKTYMSLKLKCHKN